MKSLTTQIAGALFTVILIAGCFSSDDDSSAPMTMTPMVSGTVDQVLLGGVTSDASAIDAAALQSDLDSLSGGTRNAEPIAILEGDTVASIVNRARTR